MERQAEIKARIDEFHAHLDKCKQCANNPFDLCAKGSRLIRAIAPQKEESAKNETK